MGVQTEDKKGGDKMVEEISSPKVVFNLNSMMQKQGTSNFD
jgi:hypothetical protein